MHWQSLMNFLPRLWWKFKHSMMPETSDCPLITNCCSIKIFQHQNCLFDFGYCHLQYVIGQWANNFELHIFFAKCMDLCLDLWWRERKLYFTGIWMGAWFDVAACSGKSSTLFSMRNVTTAWSWLQVGNLRVKVYLIIKWSCLQSCEISPQSNKTTWKTHRSNTNS